MFKYKISLAIASSGGRSVDLDARLALTTLRS